MNASVSYDTFVDPGDKTCSIDWELPEGFAHTPASDITGTGPARMGDILRHWHQSQAC